MLAFKVPFAAATPLLSHVGTAQEESPMTTFASGAKCVDLLSCYLTTRQPPSRRRRGILLAAIMYCQSVGRTGALHLRELIPFTRVS